MPADHHHNLRTVLAFALLALVVALLCGCTETRSTTDAQTDTQVEKSETLNVVGTITIPLPEGGAFPVPVDLTVHRTATETKTAVTSSKSESKTAVDGAAIAQQLGGMLGKTMDAAIAKLTGFQVSNAARSGITTTEGVLGGTGGALAAWAIREMLARRRETQALLEVKEARNAAQREALELAKKVDPKDARGDA